MKEVGNDDLMDQNMELHALCNGLLQSFLQFSVPITPPMNALLALMQTSIQPMISIDRASTARVLRAYATCVETSTETPAGQVAKRDFLDACTTLGAHLDLLRGAPIKGRA